MFFFGEVIYSSASKRAEAYTLFCHAQTLTDFALQQHANSTNKVLTLNRQLANFLFVYFFGS